VSCGHFRYSDLKEAARVGRLCDLNSADGCRRLSGCRVRASGSRYQGGRFDAQYRGEEVDSSWGLYQRRYPALMTVIDSFRWGRRCLENPSRIVSQIR
jgi:hypothetical protein